MVDPQLVAFIGVAVAVVVAPGPDMALVLRNTLAGGRRGGLATVLGIVVALLLWSLLAAAGVAALLASSAVAFTVVKLAGGLYLIYLGVITLRRTSPPVGRPPAASVPVRAGVAQGFASAALNPKLGVFFLTLLPQFIAPGSPPWRSLELALIFGAIGLAWLTVYTQLIAALGDVLSGPRPRRVIERITGCVLIALGARTALGSR